MTKSDTSTTQHDKTALQIKEKDIKPLIVGVAMLLVAGIIGYSLGFRSAQGVIEATTPSTNTALQPTVEVVKQPNEEKEIVQSIPADWVTYDAFFGVAKYTFQYPPEYIVSDTNVRTGQLYVFPQENFSFPAALVMDTLNRTFYFQEYESGSVKDWFLKNIQIVYPDSDFSQLSVETVKLQGGKAYLKISNWPENTRQINPNLFSGTWYIMADPQVSYYMVDNGVMSKEDVERVLSTLNVTTQ